MFGSDVMKEDTHYGHTSLKKLYFSFNGRIARSTFWLKFGLPYLVIIIISYIISIPTTKEELEEMVTFFTIYPTIVMQVKRLHDLDKSWWYLLFLFIPLLNIYISFLILFFKGTTGTNRYGRDPLEP